MRKPPWADWSSINGWVEYEARLNHVLPHCDDPVICTYNTNLLNGTLAMDILRTHSVAIIGGALRKNPLFLRPEEFLREVLGRLAEPKNTSDRDAERKFFAESNPRSDR